MTISALKPWTADLSPCFWPPVAHVPTSVACPSHSNNLHCVPLPVLGPFSVFLLLLTTSLLEDLWGVTVHKSKSFFLSLDTEFVLLLKDRVDRFHPWPQSSFIRGLSKCPQPMLSGLSVGETQGSWFSVPCHLYSWEHVAAFIRWRTADQNDVPSA